MISAASNPKLERLALAQSLVGAASAARLFGHPARCADAARHRRHRTGPVRHDGSDRGRKRRLWRHRGHRSNGRGKTGTRIHPAKPLRLGLGSERLDVAVGKRRRRCEMHRHHRRDSSGILGNVDIVTNSGHLRPLTAALIDHMPSSAVIALMFEAWEFRPEDIDLQACARRGIPVVGVNERHEAVDVFSFLGPLCAKQLHDCGLSVCRNRIALLCDNGFAEPIMRGLMGLGAHVELFAEVAAVRPDGMGCGRRRPVARPRTSNRACRSEALAALIPPEAVVVQFWGDVDRHAAMFHCLNLWPTPPPSAGHMAVLLSEIGPEPIVRLQTGGLRAAEWIRRGGAASPDGFAQIVQQT